MNKKELFFKEFKENKELLSYIAHNKFSFIDFFDEGRSSWIVKMKKGRKLFTFKIAKKHSSHKKIIEKECFFLNLLKNKRFVPRLYYCGKSFIVYYYLDAIPLRYCISDKKPKDIIEIVKNALANARELDSLGIDHGQLANRGTNILVSKNNYVYFIDFEKASCERKVHNYSVLYSYFFISSSFVSKVIKEKLGKDFFVLKEKYSFKK